MHVAFRNRAPDHRRLAGLTLVIASLVICGSAMAQVEDFSYNGDHGPGFWGETADWIACAGTSATQRQSPIDIEDVFVDRFLRPLQLQLLDTPIALINNGHSIEEEYAPGSSLTFEGLLYNLSQFHFHTLSEHTVRTQHGAMELHAVFADPRSDRKVVVGMLYKIGRNNAFLAELLAHGLPTKSGNEVNAPASFINLKNALTSTAKYYTYPGSLTTPPCSETVTWFVLRDQAELSEDQLEAFRHILGNDFRPLQKLNRRIVHATPSDDNNNQQ